MATKPLDLIQSFPFGILLGVIIIIGFLPLVSSIGDNLLDAAPQADGEPDIKELDATNWVIIRKKLAWGEASLYCDKKYLRLTTLATKDQALALVKAIEGISEKFTDPYLKKYKEVEFGMDRRYWIGLTDQIQEGKWYWTHDGSELAYEFWYPNQPDHKKSGTDTKSTEHCVTLWNPGFYEKTANQHTFNDEDCSGKYYFICDAKAPDPAAAVPDPSASASG